MKNKTIIFTSVVVLAVLCYSFFFLGTKHIENDTENVVMSTSTGFVPVVTPLATTTKTETTKPVVKNPTPAPVPVNSYSTIGNRKLINGVFVTPMHVTYDGRCPVDVKCIQAGTVDLGVLLQNGNTSQNLILTLGKPVIFVGKEITLARVSPDKYSKKVINESDYRFLITVKN